MVKKKEHKLVAVKSSIFESHHQTKKYYLLTFYKIHLFQAYPLKEVLLNILSIEQSNHSPNSLTSIILKVE